MEAKAEAQTKQASPDAANAAPSTAPEAQGQEAASNRKQQRAQMKKERSAPNEAASAATTAKSPSTSAKTKTSATTAAQAKTASAPAPKANGKVKKPAPQVVEKIKTQHANFKAQARPETVPSVTFNQSYRIQGADQWQGAQYGVFRSYRPARHDQSYYRSHYSRVEVIGGGAYYFSNGYWYPAWGYNPSAQYYAYDGPIYVGSRGVPPDRVIADVQAILQEQGYYKGEVDGLLGPLTRQALTAYQTDAGLYPTAASDEPTLSSLNLG
ncbi:MAG: peptidoglycan-binding domain-containing protein [Chthoniobacterales bacterium]